MDLTRADISGMDAEVDAVGAWDPMNEAVHYQGLLHVIQLLTGTPTRYLKVGGANTLYINYQHTKILLPA